MNRIVRCWLAPRRSRAWRITARTSSTRAETADSSSKSAPVRSATIRASVVLPTPGGPKRIIDGGRSSSIARRSAEPSASTWRWPTRSSSAAVGCAAAEARSDRRDRAPRPRRGPPWRQYAHRMSEPEAEDFSEPLLPGHGAERLRAVPEHRGAARPAEGPRRVGASRRAAVPGRAPVVGAVAQAGHARGGGGGRAHHRGGRRAARSAACGAPALCLRYITGQLDMLEQMSPWEYQTIREVLGHGSGFDSPGFRSLRAALPATRRGVPPGARDGRPLACRPLRARPRARGAVPARRRR